MKIERYVLNRRPMPYRVLQVADRQVVPVVCGIAKIVEEGHVQTRKRLPPVFRVQQDGRQIAEAEIGEPPDRVFPADGEHVIERHSRPGGRIVPVERSLYGEHAFLVEDGEVD